MWSLLEFFPEDFQINILDVGAALSERPPYQSLVEVGRGKIFGFEPNREACERLNREYGNSHRFFPFFVGDGRQFSTRQTGYSPDRSTNQTPGFLRNSKILRKS
jgi:hypothetical protein